MTLLRVDFHAHTFASKDSLTTTEIFLNSLRRKNLDRVVITDHNTIDGATRIQKHDPVHIIIGEEIMTSRGEILAAYVKECVPAGLSPVQTIEILRDQGAFISISHPFDAWRNGGWDIGDLEKIVSMVDAIEVFNARCIRKKFNQQAAEYAERNNVAGTAGSDAHTAMELGACTVLLPEFGTAEELRNVISAGTIHGKPSPFWVHFGSRYARTRKKVGV
jgi:hypothetical protein